MAEHKKSLNIAMVGSGFIARAHSNAFHQTGRFFNTPFELNTKLVCARDRNKLDRFAFVHFVNVDQVIAAAPYEFDTKCSVPSRQQD